MTFLEFFLRERFFSGNQSTGLDRFTTKCQNINCFKSSIMKLFCGLCHLRYLWSGHSHNLRKAFSTMPVFVEWGVGRGGGVIRRLDAECATDISCIASPSLPLSHFHTSSVRRRFNRWRERPLLKQKMEEMDRERNEMLQSKFGKEINPSANLQVLTRFSLLLMLHCLLSK